MPARPIIDSTLRVNLTRYRLTTAAILYHLPDHPLLLEEFIWQHDDIAPRFPVLNKFLRFWQVSIEGKLHSVRVASRGLVSDAELRLVNGDFMLN